jgi:PKHD-type hydroxylase
MNLTNSYYYFKSVIPERICDDIVKYGNQMKSEKAGIDHDNTGSEFNLKKRNSNIVWTSDQWIYKEIQPYIHEANKRANWNFQWDYCEPCQITTYKKDQYYDWHSDSWAKPYGKDKNVNIGFQGKIRKLSVTVSLSDSNDYKGGELEFDLRNKHPSEKNFLKCEEILPKGSLVVFPSFLWHRVNPIKEGVRKSLVIWCLGYEFK